MTQTNCKNCGAPLTGCVCEYCGTDYGEREKKRLGASSFVDALIEVSQASAFSAKDLLGTFTPNEIREAHGLTMVLYADNEPVLEIEDKPERIQRPKSLGGVITH